MISEVRNAAGAAGPLLHPNRTMNFMDAVKGTGRGKQTHVAIDDLGIDIILLEGSVTYLGRMATSDLALTRRSINGSAKVGKRFTNISG